MVCFISAGSGEISRLFLSTDETQAENSGGTVGRDGKRSGISDNSMSAIEMIVCIVCVCAEVQIV